MNNEDLKWINDHLKVMHTLLNKEIGENAWTPTAQEAEMCLSSNSIVTPGDINACHERMDRICKEDDHQFQRLDQRIDNVLKALADLPPYKQSSEITHIQRELTKLDHNVAILMHQQYHNEWTDKIDHKVSVLSGRLHDALKGSQERMYKLDKLIDRITVLDDDNNVKHSDLWQTVADQHNRITAIEANGYATHDDLRQVIIEADKTFRKLDDRIDKLAELLGRQISRIDQLTVAKSTDEPVSCHFSADLEELKECIKQQSQLLQSQQQLLDQVHSKQRWHEEHHPDCIQMESDVSVMKGNISNCQDAIGSMQYDIKKLTTDLDVMDDNYDLLKDHVDNDFRQVVAETDRRLRALETRADDGR